MSIRKKLYVSIYEDIYDKICDGTYRAGEQLPGENILCKQMGVSRNTLRQALLLLQEDGMIINSQGKGNFVSEKTEHRDTGLEKKSDTMSQFCKTPHDRIEIDVNVTEANKFLQGKFGSDKVQILIVTDVVYFLGDEVTATSVVFINYDDIADRGLDLKDHDRMKAFLKDYITTQAKTIRTRIKVAHSSEKVAVKLQREEGEALLYLDELMYSDKGKCIVYARNYLRDEYYELFVNRK